MQRILEKLMPTSGNVQPGKSVLFNDAGKFAFTGVPFLANKKQKDELSREKINEQTVMFDFFGALNY